MTALPLHSAPGHPAAASGSVTWFPIDEAAALIGRNVGHLRRQCPRMGEQARKFNGTWHLHVTADPRLHRAAVERTESGGSAVTELLKSTTADKRDEAQRRANVVVEFRRWKAQPGVNVKTGLAAFLEAAGQRHGLKLTRSTVYGWDQRCPASTDFDGCVAALIDTRGRPKTGSVTLNDSAWSFFCSVYLTEHQLSIRHCWEMTRARAEADGWGWPSVSRIKQLVRERLDPGTVTLRREGREAWQRKHLAPIEQDPEAWDAGQCWEGDHTPFDFSVRVFRNGSWSVTRAQLTAWLDRRSRRLMGWHISEQGNQGTIRLALLDALKADGVSVPEVVWIDNGKDFMAASIGGLTKAERRGMTRDEKREAESRCAGLLRMLSIEPHFATAYNHNGKARIERFFGTLHQRFDRTFTTWCGSRPGMLDRKVLNEKLRDVMSLPTLDELREQFAEWAEWYNHRHDHGIEDLDDREAGERLSPVEFYERFLPARRVVDRSALPLLEATWSPRPVKVSKHGVSVKIAGRTVRYGEMMPELEPLVGSDKRVFISYDPDDTGSVEVWDENFRHLCTAHENGRHGGLADDRVSVADRRAANAHRREQRRRARQRVDYVSLSLSDAELASQQSRERDIAETQDRLRAAGHSNPPPLRLVQTPVDGQGDAPERSRARKAAGADRDEFPSVVDALADEYRGQLSNAPHFDFSHLETDLDHGFDTPPSYDHLHGEDAL